MARVSSPGIQSQMLELNHSTKVDIMRAKSPDKGSDSTLAALPTLASSKMGSATAKAA